MPKYHVRNWKDYNESLVKRGALTLWIDKDLLMKWGNSHQTGKRGRPLQYPDELIIAALSIKALYKITYRMTEGFLKSLFELNRLSLKTPDYSTLCKRQKMVDLTHLARVNTNKEPLVLAIDSTGIKLYGEGEWKVRVHGKSKRRDWRKIHVAIDVTSQCIEAIEMTASSLQDCEAFPVVLNKIDSPLKEVLADGAYDRFSCYEEADKRGFRLITPPQKNARTSKEYAKNKQKGSINVVATRDKIIERAREAGRKEWKQETGYHRRSLAETAMFRLKTTFGGRFASRTWKAQQTELAIWGNLLNRFTALGLPDSVLVG